MTKFDIWPETRLASGRKKLDGETYDSADAVAQFFQKRGIPFSPGGSPQAGAGSSRAAGRPNRTFPPKQSKPTLQARAPRGAKAGKLSYGVKVRHKRYGLGTVMRREGDGEDAKVTVHFQQHGLKKMVVKYAGLQPA